MDSTVIDLLAYRAQQTSLESPNGPAMSNELITEIQLLIKRLREANPIKQTG